MLTVLYWTQDYQYVHTKTGNRILRVHVHTRQALAVAHVHVSSTCTSTHPYHFVPPNYLIKGPSLSHTAHTLKCMTEPYLTMKRKVPFKVLVPYGKAVRDTLENDHRAIIYFLFWMAGQRVHSIEGLRFPRVPG